MKNQNNDSNVNEAHHLKNGGKIKYTANGKFYTYQRKSGGNFFANILQILVIGIGIYIIYLLVFAS